MRALDAHDADEERFNSKLVRLEVSFANHPKLFHYRFNSKLVRLEDYDLFETKRLRYEFQFQIGAIRGLMCLYITNALTTVSIPNWCD